MKRRRRICLLQVIGNDSRFHEIFAIRKFNGWDRVWPWGFSVGFDTILPLDTYKVTHWLFFFEMTYFPSRVGWISGYSTYKVLLVILKMREIVTNESLPIA